MATAVSPTIRGVENPSEQRFLLRAVDWRTYRTISEALTGRHVRLTFDGWNLEFMTISPLHGNFSRLLARFVNVLTEEFELPIRSFGDMTCDREDLTRGLEPDECFYITNEPVVRGQATIDLTTDPRPDLAVEVELSRGAPDRMAIYAAIRVPEVWRFDGRTLSVWQLSPDGQYQTREQSRYFPGLNVGEIAAFLLRWAEMDENSLVELFRQWVRGQVQGTA